MKNKELIDLSITEIQDKLATESARLAKLKIAHTISPLENTNILKETRKNIARLSAKIRHLQINSLRKTI